MTAAVMSLSPDEASELEQVLARPPAHRLTYPGDVRHMAELHQLVGPNTLGEVLAAVDAELLEGPPRTRVGFVYVPLELVGLAERRPDGTVVFGQVAR